MFGRPKSCKYYLFIDTAFYLIQCTINKLHRTVSNHTVSNSFAIICSYYVTLWPLS